MKDLFTIIVLSVLAVVVYVVITDINTPQCQFVNEFIENWHAGVDYEEYEKHWASYTVKVTWFPF